MRDKLKAFYQKHKTIIHASGAGVGVVVAVKTVQASRTEKPAAIADVQMYDLPAAPSERKLVVITDARGKNTHHSFTSTHDKLPPLE